MDINRYSNASNLFRYSLNTICIPCWIAIIDCNLLIQLNSRSLVKVKNPIASRSVIFNSIKFNRARALYCGCFIVSNSTEIPHIAIVTIIVSGAFIVITSFAVILPDFDLASLKFFNHKTFTDPDSEAARTKVSFNSHPSRLEVQAGWFQPTTPKSTCTALLTWSNL